MVGSSNKKGRGPGVVLEVPGGFQLDLSLRIKFKTSNNQTEYEALITSLILDRDVGATTVVCKSDSRLIVGHIKGDYQVKDPLLLQYYHKVKDVMPKFDKSKIEHIPREQNLRANSLSELESCKRQIQQNSVIQQIMCIKTVGVTRCFKTTSIQNDWIKTLKEFIMAQEQGNA